MDGNEQVVRQYKEVRAYNLFYSCLTGRADPNLAERGWITPIEFGEMYDKYSDTRCDPDFVLYNGDICLIVELKSGNNISERDIEQMEKADQMTIDGIESEIKDTDLSNVPYDGTVTGVDHCIIYQDIDEEWVEKCLNNWESCEEALRDLMDTTAVLTQDYGGELRTVAGNFGIEIFKNIFSDNSISLPEEPSEEYLLTENMEKEVLADAICEVWGQRVLDHADPITVGVSEIREFFSPTFNISIEKLRKTMFYLSKIDACDHDENLQYEFSREKYGNVLSIRERLLKERVEETLSDVDESEIPDNEQLTLSDDFDSQSVADGGDGAENGSPNEE
jgi:hypothetical protein